MTLSRRTLLGAGAAALASLTGCLGGSGGNDCPDGYSRFDPTGTVHASPWNDWALAAPDGRLGEQLPVTLTNEADEPRTTPNRNRFLVQRRAEGDWRSVVWADQPVAFTDEAVGHQPGEGFTWTLQPTSEGIGHPKSELRGCEALDAGEYRFVYWGVGDDDALGARFALEK